MPPGYYHINISPAVSVGMCTVIIQHQTRKQKTADFSELGTMRRWRQPPGPLTARVALNVSPGLWSVEKGFFIQHLHTFGANQGKKTEFHFKESWIDRRIKQQIVFLTPGLILRVPSRDDRLRGHRGQVLEFHLETDKKIDQHTTRKI